MLYCFQLVNISAPGILSCLITTTARLVCLLNARVKPAAKDYFTGDVSFFYFRTASIPQCALFLHLLGKIIAGVQSTEDSEHTFVTYPVLLLVSRTPSASLRGSACSLLLLSCHSNLPLDRLLLWSCRPGALLLLWAVGGHRHLCALMGDNTNLDTQNLNH